MENSDEKQHGKWKFLERGARKLIMTMGWKNMVKGTKDFE